MKKQYSNEAPRACARDISLVFGRAEIRRSKNSTHSSTASQPWSSAKVDKKNIKQIKFKKESDLPLSAISLADTRYNKTGKWRSIKPIIDYNRCTSCMICWKFCPDVAIKIIDGKPHIELDYCKGCAICIEECPAKAIGNGDTSWGHSTRFTHVITSGVSPIVKRVKCPLKHKK